MALAAFWLASLPGRPGSLHRRLAPHVAWRPVCLWLAWRLLYIGCRCECNRPTAPEDSGQETKN